MASNNLKDRFQLTKTCGRFHLSVLWVAGGFLSLVLSMLLLIILNFGMANPLGPVILP